MTVYFTYFMLDQAGWDWALVLGFIEAAFFGIVGLVLSVLTVSEVNLPSLTAACCILFHLYALW